MILYQYPGGDGLSSVSPPCMKVEMALKLVGAEYRVENITTPAQLRRASATGRLPVLELDGEPVHDSVVILDRLERRFPEAPLWPKEPAARIEDRLWEHFVNDHMYWFGFYLRWIHPVYAPRTFTDLFGRRLWPVRIAVRATVSPRQRRRARLHGVGGKTPEAVREEMERALDMLVAGLRGGPFLQQRNHPGRGDLACAALIVQAGFRKTLTETMGQVRARPQLTAHAGHVLEACGMETPDWLAG